MTQMIRRITTYIFRLCVDLLCTVFSIYITCLFLVVVIIFASAGYFKRSNETQRVIVRKIRHIRFVCESKPVA
jgi:hypothetical protein